MKKGVKKTSLAKELKRKEFRVSIFGSARIKKDDKNYKQVYKLANMLGERGIDLVTGGGPGLMKAGNIGHKQGSKKTKAHSIGLAIRLPNEQGTNKGVQIEKKFSRFSNRLDNFMLLSNAVVVAPGGVGTVLEFLYTWQLMQVKQTCNIPIILLGDGWSGLIEWLEKVPLKRKYLDKKDMKLLFLAKDCNEAIKMIDTAHNHYKKGGDNVCLNYKKYKLY